MDTREAIVTAAREEFASRGYDGASLRAVARRAGVDPRMVHHYFVDKSELFAESMDVPLHPRVLVGQVLAGDPDRIGERLVRLFIDVWDSPPGRLRMTALLQSATAHEDAARVLREFLAREVFGRIAGELGVDDAMLRGALTATQMVGLAMARIVVRVEPLASASGEDIVRWIAPTVQRYLTGPLD